MKIMDIACDVPTINRKNILQEQTKIYTVVYDDSTRPEYFVVSGVFCSMWIGLSGWRSEG
jgi:hypothetical protein